MDQFDDMRVGETWMRTFDKDQMLLLCAARMGEFVRPAEGSAVCCVIGYSSPSSYNEVILVDQIKIFHDVYGTDSMIKYRKVPWVDLPLCLGMGQVGRILPAIISGELWVPRDQWDIRPNVKEFLERHEHAG